MMGHIDSADVFQDGKARWPSGYVFSIDATGKWTLSSFAYKKLTLNLAAGSEKVPTEKWHHAELSFKADQISVSLDGKVLFRGTDSSHTHGMFAIGTGWNHAQFDNLSVTP